MSEQWTFYFEPDKCIGCHACSVACDVQNDRIDGDNWRNLRHEPTGSFPDYEETAVSTSCFHCGDAPCEKVCPTGAITKRDSDGVVTVDQDKCISCHYCGWACPYGAPTYNPDNDGKMSKCHLCLGEGEGDGHGKPPRAEQDGDNTPNCVDNCVTDALHAGPVSEMMELASERAVKQFVDGNRRALIEPVEPDSGGD